MFEKFMNWMSSVESWTDSEVLKLRNKKWTAVKLLGAAIIFVFAGITLTLLSGCTSTIPFLLLPF